jgi:3'(2'), 5'-bisphosphate nucleotidase
MADNYEAELQCAIEAVRRASRICRNVGQMITADVLAKKDRSPVTVADFASQAAICLHMQEHMPEDPIVGEEDSSELRRPENASFLDRICRELEQAGIQHAGHNDICRWIDRGNATGGADRFWTLDPIDGTKGFLRGGQYAIALALIVEGDIKVSVLGCPNLPVTPEQTLPRGLLLTAVRGQGAAAVPLDGTATALPVWVSGTGDSTQARFCESVEAGHSSHDRSAQVARLLGITRPPVRIDSQAKYATVARGEADIYLRLPVRRSYVEKIWDHAGGALIVEEAGGTVTDIDGKPLEFHHGRELTANRGVVVTNGPLHQQVLAAVADTIA